MVGELLYYISGNEEYIQREPTYHELLTLAPYPYHFIIRPLVVQDFWRRHSIQQAVIKYDITYKQARYIKENFT